MDRLIAWLGGGIFVASLAVCGWWYFVALGDAAPPRSDAAVAAAFDTALITIFALHHSLFARDALKRRLSAIPAHLVRTLYVWVASLLLILVVAMWRRIGGIIYDAHGILTFAHIALQLLGLWLIVRATAGLDPLELAGIRAARHDTGGESLQVGGPYRVVRHPLYLGWILLFCGIPRMTGDRLVFAALTSAYLMIAIPLEERSLVQSFGDEYRRYRARVRWRVIPFVY
jgi:protein-S-isoprenylcysteine O-methyltransferase Ste14